MSCNEFTLETASLALYLWGKRVRQNSLVENKMHHSMEVYTTQWPPAGQCCVGWCRESCQCLCLQGFCRNPSSAVSLQHDVLPGSWGDSVCFGDADRHMQCHPSWDCSWPNVQSLRYLFVFSGCILLSCGETRAVWHRAYPKWRLLPWAGGTDSPFPLLPRKFDSAAEAEAWEVTAVTKRPGCHITAGEGGVQRQGKCLEYVLLFTQSGRNSLTLKKQEIKKSLVVPFYCAGLEACEAWCNSGNMRRCGLILQQFYSLVFCPSCW